MKRKSVIISLTLCAVSSIALVAVLFAFSEDIVHRNNSFLRRYPHHAASKANALDLGFNSYYIAGAENGRIYLGNVTAPLQVLNLSEDLKDTVHIRLSLPWSENYEFRSVKLKVKKPYFYLSDGTVPVIFRGTIGNWKASPFMEGSAYFSQLEPMGSNSFAIRARSSTINENELGKITVTDTTLVKLAPALLQKQIDGIFDVDGMLHYNDDLKKLIYVYYYRNEYIVAEQDMNLNYQGKTIDTVSRAQIDIASIASKQKSTLATQALIINGQSCVSGNYLFVNSERLGKYESKKMLEQASIIDVYDLRKNTYELSFYLYDHKEEKMNSFRVFDDLLVAIMDDHIVTYTLKPEYFELKKKAINSISPGINKKKH